MELFLVTARVVDAPARRRLVLEHQPRGERVVFLKRDATHALNDARRPPLRSGRLAQRRSRARASSMNRPYWHCRKYETTFI